MENYDAVFKLENEALSIKLTAKDETMYVSSYQLTLSPTQTYELLKFLQDSNIQKSIK